MFHLNFSDKFTCAENSLPNIYIYFFKSAISLIPKRILLAKIKLKAMKAAVAVKVAPFNSFHSLTLDMPL